MAFEISWRFPLDQASLFPPSSFPARHSRAISGLCGAYMVGVLAVMFKTTGAWPMASYTMTSWSLITLRHLFRAIGAPLLLQNLIRFPSVAGASTTVLVWWIFLVPAIAYFAGPKQRRWFLKFNFSPFLLNVHFLNLPLSMLDHALSPRWYTALFTLCIMSAARIIALTACRACPLAGRSTPRIFGLVALWASHTSSSTSSASTPTVTTCTSYFHLAQPGVLRVFLSYSQYMQWSGSVGKCCLMELHARDLSRGSSFSIEIRSIYGVCFRCSS